MFVLLIVLLHRCVFVKSMFQACMTYLLAYLFGGLLECAVAIMFFEVDEFVEKVIVTIVVIAGIWLYHFLVGKRLDKEMFQFSLSLWGMLIAFLLIVDLMLSYFDFLMSSVVQENMRVIGNILILFSGMAICGLLIGIAHYFSRTSTYRLQKENAEKLNEQQKEYFTQLLEKERDTRQFRHDIIAHLVAMEELTEEGELEELSGYLKSLLKDVRRISGAQYHVGNDIVDTIINYYFQPIRQKCNIKVGGAMGEADYIAQKDMCAFISNLAKNAVEAVSCLPEEEREIRFLVEQGKENLRIYMENTYTGTLSIDKNGSVKTIKKDEKNHGYGLKNVLEIIERYGGEKDINAEEKRFRVDVTFHINKCRKACEKMN
jgi:hypothetical protein